VGSSINGQRHNGSAAPSSHCAVEQTDSRAPGIRAQRDGRRRVAGRRPRAASRRDDRRRTRLVDGTPIDRSCRGNGATAAVQCGMALSIGLSINSSPLGHARDSTA
jgi:hypothetical protein